MSRPLTAEMFWEIINSLKTPKATSEITKMATIDPNYSSGRPRVIIDGEETVGSKRYPYASTYTPKANDRVVILKVKGTWVVQYAIL